jgi:predicted GIY-YIG superfamily endonuclease
VPAERDCRKYVLKKERKIVYAGITDDLKRREQEHRKSGKVFDNMEQIGRAVTEESAREWERQMLDRYRRNHGGKGPKYNTNG